MTKTIYPKNWRHFSPPREPQKPEEYFPESETIEKRKVGNYDSTVIPDGAVSMYI